MFNELLWFIFMGVTLLLAVVIFWLWEKEGLYALISISTFVCNIQVIKLVKLFGLTSTLGNVVYGSIFFSTDILSEVYGKKEARKGVWIGFFTLLMATLSMQFALGFKPDPEDFMNPHLLKIFGFLPRVVFASFTAYLLSQHHDVWAFHFWKKKTRGKFLWLRNNLSTMVSQFIDTLTFCFLAFWGVFPLEVFWQILITTYFFKWIVAGVDTPFIYLARNLAQRKGLMK